ncbi:MAG: hypothetical protein H7Y07_03625 [Pyrinomonadaceae bacterium]|nr:hypothetical protein [Sphingobacteriaceae bacterium]
MKNLKILLLLFSLATFGVVGCKKDSPAEPSKETPDTQAQAEAKTKVIGKWYIKKAVYTYKSDGHNDTYANYDNTQFYDFKTDGTLVISFVKKQGTNYTYKFNEDAGTLSIFTPFPDDVYKIKVFTGTSLIIEKEHTIAPAMTEEITLSK